MLWSKENPVRFLVLSEDTLVEQIIEEATNHLLLQEYGIEQDPPLLYINPLEDEDENGAITPLIDEYSGEVISYRIDPNLVKKDKIWLRIDPKEEEKWEEFEDWYAEAAGLPLKSAQKCPIYILISICFYIFFLYN